MNKVEIIGDITPAAMIEIKYHRAKDICHNIWDNPDKSFFEDIFHDTILRCLVSLGDKKFDSDYLKYYFFKAFRINMVRYYGYAYNKTKSGLEVDDAIIPVEHNFDNHMDGFSMLEYVKDNHGEELHNMLWDNLSGHTYKELDKKYKVNTFYYLSKLKDELKKYYFDEIKKFRNNYRKTGL